MGMSGDFEAAIAAIYLDGGLEAAAEFVHRFVDPMIDEAASGDADANFKSQLQQLAQRDFHATPIYRLLDEQGKPAAKPKKPPAKAKKPVHFPIGLAEHSCWTEEPFQDPKTFVRSLSGSVCTSWFQRFHFTNWRKCLIAIRYRGHWQVKLYSHVFKANTALMRRAVRA